MAGATIAANYRAGPFGDGYELDRLAAPARQWLRISVAARSLSAEKAVNYRGWSGAAMATNSSR